METAKGSGEMRTVNVVYFLSRNGRIEHPHLIRFRSLHRNGIRLYDVKRWLSDLRGRDMPDSFAWSYKRRYRNGYVWQDLLDDDLITPIADNEYVLKGCQLPKSSNSTSAKKHRFPSPTEDSVLSSDDDDEKNAKYAETKEKRGAEKGEAAEILEISPEDCPVSPKIPPPTPLDEESPLLFGELMKQRAVVKMDASKEKLKEKLRRELEKEEEERKSMRNTSLLKTKNDCYSYSKRISQVFQSCCNTNAVKTNDAALRWISRKYSNGDNNCSRRRGSGGKTGSKRAGEKPMGVPNCSQCGKEFKPERMHAHMISCRSLKKRGKGQSGI